MYGLKCYNKAKIDSFVKSRFKPENVILSVVKKLGNLRL